MGEKALELENQDNWRFEKKTILLVDDSQQIINLLGKALDHDFDVLGVKDSSDALIMAENFKPDLILLDYELPHIDGLELLKRFTEHPLTMDVPIVMISGNEDVQLRETAYDMGASGFLTKPFDYKSISSDIFSALDNLNTVVENEETGRSFYTYFNSKMKLQSIQNMLVHHQLEEEKVIMLSWLPPAKLVGPREEEMIENGELIFFQIKSSLIVKFPYMSDLSIIIEELRQLCDEDLSQFNLIFDEPRNLMNLYKSESALSQAMALSNNLYSVFNRVIFLNTRLQDPSYAINLQKLGRVLLGY